MRTLTGAHIVHVITKYWYQDGCDHGLASLRMAGANPTSGRGGSKPSNTHPHAPEILRLFTHPVIPAQTRATRPRYVPEHLYLDLAQADPCVFNAIPSNSLDLNPFFIRVSESHTQGPSWVR